ncbi:GatB/YqeY domain-containing protein [Antrihabitans cavernicola]|uniref:Glutamyl-tRNA amidotransferase n=1 Tax=Antrihabitans cavernicola TaxID=2495913 RepID=A0A5A7SER6_9NOCA|nr:GatB/YqeY domain-containing protein [Spelaeibacter cavernicola]KAA0023632.1 hypothetical protein FOY51_09635 [Spelaeibacter cavernicola]
MRTELRRDLTTAMKAKDRTAVAALRSALAAIDNAEAVPSDSLDAVATDGEHVAGAHVGLGAADVARRVLTDGDVRSIIESEVHERDAAAEKYEAMDRADDALRLRSEGDVLRRYLAHT